MIVLEVPAWEFLFRFPSAKSEQVMLPGVIRKRVQHNKQSRAYKQSRSLFFIEMVGQKEVSWENSEHATLTLPWRVTVTGRSIPLA